MAKQKIKLIIIAPPNDYKREIICDDFSSGSGYYYFYNTAEDNRRKIICYYPIVNTMIESIEDFVEIKEEDKPKEEGKIINEVKGINS
jgi:flavin-dependent dehydrogenase